MTVVACEYLEHGHRECWTTEANEMAIVGVCHVSVMADPVVGACYVEGDDVTIVGAPSHELTVERP